MTRTEDGTIDLPGSPPPVFEAVWRALSASEQHALVLHLIGETSAEWLSSTLGRHGHLVSASTIRCYRRSLRQTGA